MPHNIVLVIVMKNFCRDLEFSTAVNTLAAAIAAKFDDADELTAAASIFVQIGDTMEAIAANRILCDKQKNKKSE